ncbi:hypothetical protein ECEC1736_3344, partial [Escherichia coli EC1736]
CPL